MIAPTILGLMILNIIPFFQTIYMSFSKTKAFGAYQFCGLENYLEMFRNAEFWKANWNSLSTSASSLCRWAFFWH